MYHLWTIAFPWLTNSKLKLKANKTEFLIIGTQKQCGKLVCFSQTPMLSHNFESPLIIIFILDCIFHKLVVAAFIMFVTFVVIVGLCILLPAKLLQLLLLAVDLIIAIPFKHNIALNDILKLQRVQYCLARVVTRFPHFSHSLPLLKTLHLPHVRYRIIFKICTITCQAQ